MSDAYTREKRSKRRKATFNKKRRDYEDTKYSFFSKYVTEPYVVNYTSELIPEREIPYIIPCFNEYTGNTYYTEQTRIIPEHIRRIPHRTYLSDKEYVKVIDISNRRQFAKKMTNRRMRHLKYEYEDGIWSTYIGFVNGNPVVRYRYEDCDWDVKINLDPSGYRKVFDYKWEIW